MLNAAVFVVFAAGTTPICGKGIAGQARPGSESRAKAREDSPGTWEARTAPPEREGRG
jgi:hypothetical protein